MEGQLFATQLASAIECAPFSDLTDLIDMWDTNGDDIVEHLAGVEDYELALGTFRLACER
jgi:hypothetical protein